MLHIVFYDGECGLCNRAVIFLKQVDQKSILHFETLQGTLAAKHVPVEIRQALDTLVYFREDKPLLLRSDAILQALVDTNSICRLPAHLALLLPRFLRDSIYNLIAKNRHKYCRR
ncbi:MAG TPA: hypothetical protein DD622_02340 [Opitutae bacterium]|nr:hypothetical protein [Coraliomargarita sp.]HBO57257.1 hypothetical protein [Opitutae bacterium]|tara:strand:+ start:982 stop:1326 length:345 start_codon:yes stop_codon:yes gene_type:complete